MIHGSPTSPAFWNDKHGSSLKAGIGNLPVKRSSPMRNKSDLCQVESNSKNTESSLNTKKYRPECRLRGELLVQALGKDSENVELEIRNMIIQ